MAPVELSLSMPGQGIAPPVSCGIGPCQPGGAPCLPQARPGPMHQLPARMQLVTLAKADEHKKYHMHSHSDARHLFLIEKRKELSEAGLRPALLCGCRTVRVATAELRQTDPCQWVRRAPDVARSGKAKHPDGRRELRPAVLVYGDAGAVQEVHHPTLKPAVLHHGRIVPWR
jgi:hypothetical protein